MAAPLLNDIKKSENQQVGTLVYFAAAD